MSSGLRIILVEDNLTESLIWEQSLEKVCEIYRTYWPDIFCNPQDAFESIQLDNRVAAIICDWPHPCYTLKIYPLYIEAHE